MSRGRLARPAARRRAAPAFAAAALLAAAALTPGCYATQIQRLQSGLDSLRVQADSTSVRDSVAARLLADSRRELADQHDLLLATRATTSSTQRDVAETLARLEGKLDDIMARFRIASERAPATPATPPAGAGAAEAGPTPAQLYDQATQDLTQGRYTLALQGYREFMRRFPDAGLAPSAQFGVGECFFAQAQYDSAAVEYARVDARWPTGDRTPAALYKRALSEDRLARSADARRTLEDLVRRFPSSSEAQLARDRLGAAHH